MENYLPFGIVFVILIVAAFKFGLSRGRSGKTWSGKEPADPKKPVRRK